MIFWGGEPGPGGVMNTGGRYDPAGDSWQAVTTTGAPVSRRSHGAVWAGSEMIVWGGSDGGFLNTGKRYRPPVALAAGIYTGTITVSDPGAANSPQTVSVTFTVTP